MFSSIYCTFVIPCWQRGNFYWHVTSLNPMIMKNHPIKKIKLWHQLILILSIYLAACSAYNTFSASRYTPSTPDQKSDDQLDIPDFDFSRRSSPSPCPSFMSLSSRNMYSPSPFPLHSSFSYELIKQEPV